jgi:hypothetical protein
LHWCLGPDDEPICSRECERVGIMGRIYFFRVSSIVKMRERVFDGSREGRAGVADLLAWVKHHTSCVLEVCACASRVCVEYSNLVLAASQLSG